MKESTVAGHLIHKSRLAASMTQRQLAKAAGIGEGRLSEYESGKRDPKVDTLMRILAATDHGIALVDALDSDGVNSHWNERISRNLLNLVDTIPSESDT